MIDLDKEVEVPVWVILVAVFVLGALFGGIFL